MTQERERRAAYLYEECHRLQRYEQDGPLSLVLMYRQMMHGLDEHERRAGRGLAPWAEDLPAADKEVLAEILLNQASRILEETKRRRENPVGMVVTLYRVGDSFPHTESIHPGTVVFVDDSERDADGRPLLLRIRDESDEDGKESVFRLVASEGPSLTIGHGHGIGGRDQPFYANEGVTVVTGCYDWKYSAKYLASLEEHRKGRDMPPTS